MRKQVIIKNGKKFLVTVASYGDEGMYGDTVGTGSTPYILPFISSIITPVTQSLHSGSTYSFTLSAGPSGPFDYIAYQWRTGSLNLVNDSHYTGSQTNTLTINSVSASMAGTYNLIVINQFGVATSSLFKVVII